MLCTFSFGCFQIYQNKSAKNIAIYFIGTIVPIKCMPKISAVGLFCLDKFENNQTRTCTTFFRTSKLTEVYFSRTSPKCYKCPKKHIGPTIWFHSIKLKLFKLIFINRFNDLFLLFSEMTVLQNQNKAREEPVSWILKSFNLIEWNQIVGPVCFLGHL